MLMYQRLSRACVDCCENLCACAELLPPLNDRLDLHSSNIGTNKYEIRSKICKQTPLFSILSDVLSSYASMLSYIGTNKYEIRSKLCKQTPLSFYFIGRFVLLYAIALSCVKLATTRHKAVFITTIFITMNCMA